MKKNCAEYLFFFFLLWGTFLIDRNVAGTAKTENNDKCLRVCLEEAQRECIGLNRMTQGKADIDKKLDSLNMFSAERIPLSNSLNKGCPNKKCDCYIKCSKESPDECK